MCFFTRGALLGVAIAVINTAAFADERTNVLQITANDLLLNLAGVELKGSGNGFFIDQTSLDGATTANRIEITVSGSGNGANLLGAPAPLIAALPWGSLVQTGGGNTMSVRMSGEANILAALQSGDGNSLAGQVSGNANQAAILQSGAGNSASFSQSGRGNMVSISQTSW